MRVSVVVGLRTSYTDSRRHGGGGDGKPAAVNVSSHDVAMLMSAAGTFKTSLDWLYSNL